MKRLLTDPPERALRAYVDLTYELMGHIQRRLNAWSSPASDLFTCLASLDSVIRTNGNADQAHHYVAAFETQIDAAYPLPGVALRVRAFMAAIAQQDPSLAGWVKLVERMFTAAVIYGCQAIETDHQRRHGPDQAAARREAEAWAGLTLEDLLKDY